MAGEEEREANKEQEERPPLKEGEARASGEARAGSLLCRITNGSGSHSKGSSSSSGTKSEGSSERSSSSSRRSGGHGSPIGDRAETKPSKPPEESGRSEKGAEHETEAKEGESIAALCQRQ